MNIVNSDPEIIYYDDFITDEECKFIIDVYQKEIWSVLK